jgi:GT2 family glycosyltransferase/glycosyltransferase involved in cell wall biosynthesis
MDDTPVTTRGSEPPTERAGDVRVSPDGHPLDVLVLSSYYWPERAGNAPYVTGVAEHLVARGHRVTVTTGFPHYPEWESHGRGVLGTHERHNGVEIRRRRHYVPGSQTAFTRALYESSLLATAVTALPTRRPDVIIGVTPTLAGAVLARNASRLYRRPFGLVFQDLQGLGALESGIEGGRRIASLVERTELRLARSATAVGVITDGFRRYFEARGVGPEAIHDLRNWSQEAEPTESRTEARARLGWGDDEFICLHAGNMGHKQGLENVLRAASAITDPETRIVLAGDGNERARLGAIAAELRLENVSFVPPQPGGLYEAMLRAADVLLVSQRSAVSEMSLASKLTSYFMASRPVIAAVAQRSETARELERAEAGLLAPADDPSALAAAITWIRGNMGAAEALGANGRAYAEANLRATTVLAEYEAFVYAVARATPRRHLAGVSGRPWQVADPEPRLIEARRPARAATEAPAQVSVAIVSFNCRDALSRCLGSLDGERSRVSLEVIVVDNASSDGTVEMVTEHFPWARVIENHTNAGFAQGVNEALELVESPYVLVLNPDTVVHPGAVAGALEELERHPDVGMLGCKLVRPDGTFDHACKRGFPTISSSFYYFLGLHRIRPTSRRFAQYTAGRLDEDDVGYVDAVNGAFMLIRAEAARQVGPLDERYWLYAEDLDWCHRFWESGWKILYWPRVEVVHWKGGSSGDLRPWALNRAFHRSMWLFYEKHYADRYPRAVSELVRAGVWAKFGLSVASTAARRPPRHAWRGGARRDAARPAGGSS